MRQKATKCNIPNVCYRACALPNRRLVQCAAGSHGHVESAVTERVGHSHDAVTSARGRDGAAAASARSRSCAHTSGAAFASAAANGRARHSLTRASSETGRRSTHTPSGTRREGRSRMEAVLTRDQSCVSGTVRSRTECGAARASPNERSAYESMANVFPWKGLADRATAVRQRPAGAATASTSWRARHQRCA